MKYLLFFLLLVSSAAYGQTTYIIRADTTTLEKVGANNELKLKNSTRSRTGAYLKNIGNGVTGFFYSIDSAWVTNDSTLVLRRGDGTITLSIPGGATGVNIYNSNGSLTGNRTVTLGSNSLTFTGNQTTFDSVKVIGGSEPGFIMRERLVNLGFPVVTFKPVNEFADKNIAFDIMPIGSPGNYSNNGIAWIDVCDADVAFGAGNVGTARVGITSTSVQFGSRLFGSGTLKPVELVVGTDTRVTLGTSNTATLNIGKITQTQSTAAADYLGYSLFNSNNTDAESNAIFFIGVGTSGNNFAYIRYNNANSAINGRAASSMEIIANVGATGGLELGTAGSTAPIRFTRTSGFSTHTEVGRVDQNNRWILGNTGSTTTTFQLEVAGTGRFNDKLTLGKASGNTGAIDLVGTTSGTVTVKPSDAAGTYNFNLPTTAGISGYLLTSGGGGSTAMTWTDPASIGGGGTPGGSNKQFQYNNSSAFGGSSMLTQETDQILITGNSTAGTTPFVVNGHEDLTNPIAEFMHSGIMVSRMTVAGGITLSEQTAPSTPGSGYFEVYAKSDGKLYGKNDAGTEYDLTASGSGSPGGSDTYVQFNDGGSFGGDAGMTFNKTDNELLINSGGDLGDYKAQVTSSTNATYFKFGDGNYGTVWNNSAMGSKFIWITGSNGSGSYSLETYDAIMQLIGANGVNIKATTNNINLYPGNTFNAAFKSTGFALYNASAPGSSETDGIILYSQDVAASAELKVRDEAGNITTLSPHNRTGLDDPKEWWDWTYHSERNGKYVTIDMATAIRTIEDQSKRIAELEKVVFGKAKGKRVKLTVTGKTK